MKTSVLVVAAVFAAVPAFGQTPPAPRPASPVSKPAAAATPHSDSQYAQELTRLKQVEVIKAQLAGAAGTAAEHLWKAQLRVAEWDDAKATPAAVQEYLAAVTAYLDSQKGGIDGAWALAHGQFVLTSAAAPVITRMEYWANGGKDRRALAPLAAAADRLLAVAAASLDSTMKAAEAKKPFDEAAYMRAYNAVAGVKYYAAWSLYFNAMAADPADPARAKALDEAAAALGEWAVDEPDNGVNLQAYLLRGKVYSEMAAGGGAGRADGGKELVAKALADFGKAEGGKAPEWVQYQARYQTVVAQLRAKDFAAAQAALAAFKGWIPKDKSDAQLSADMLGYRVAAAAAEAKGTDAEKGAARAEAMAILGQVIQRDPRFRDLVYEQLAAQIPENTDVTTLLPMQQLAVAYFNSQGQTGETPESRKQLKTAIEAAVAVRGNAAAGAVDKIEATYLAGACNTVLKNWPEAAKYNVEFAELAPGDARARSMVDLALQQIGELRKIAPLTADMQGVSQRALHLAADVFGDGRWRYAQARTLEDAGKDAEAAAIYEKLPAEDKNYLDARYRLVTLATARFGRLPATTSPAEMAAAANALFTACSTFVGLLDHPPASAPADVLERAKGYRYDIWIIEAATALNPGVKQPEVAIDRLTKLDAAKANLSEAQKAAVLRYRIQAYSLAGQMDKALAVVQEYAAANGQDAVGVIRSMVLSTVEEINRVERTDAGKARELAEYVVQLLDPIIGQAEKEEKGESAYEYRLIQADMLVRAGKAEEAGKLAVELQKKKPNDLRPFMAEARGRFAAAQAAGDTKGYGETQDYFARILVKLTPGSESFWECWLRILQSMDARGAATGPAEIKKSLTDLKGIYGSKFGGELFKGDFEKLAAKYGV